MLNKFIEKKQYFKVVFLVLLFLFLLPSKPAKRNIIIAHTPIVLPANGKTLYSEKYYRKYEILINQASEEFNVPAPLIAAVITAESGFNPYALSSAGAMGLMQLMPDTWTYLGGIGSPYNAGLNIRLGTKYLRELLDQFNDNLWLTLAAYNAGPGAVMRYRRVPPYRETRRYVPRVIKYYRLFEKIVDIG